MKVLQRHNLSTRQALFVPTAMLAVMLVVLTAACRSESASGSPVEPEPTSTTAMTPTPFPPPIVVTMATIHEVGPPKIAEIAPSATETATTQSSAMGSATDDGPASLEPASSSQPTVTDTPEPTYTAPAPPTPSPGDHYWLGRPVPQGTSTWTNKAYPYGSNRGGVLRTHHGVEFDVPAGTPILAAAAGTVAFAGDDGLELLGATNDFYGNVIVLEHDFQQDGLPVYTLYGHLSQLAVSVGQYVQANEQIGLSGASGVADGAHLHFEVRVGANSYEATRNPLLWLYPFPGRGVVAGRITWPSGEIAQNVPVSLRRVDAPSAYAATTSYADNGVNSDPYWLENFALDDVAAGYYELSVGTGDERIKSGLWVYPLATSFVELTLEN